MYDVARQVLAKSRRRAADARESRPPPEQQAAIKAALELANAERPPRDGVVDTREAHAATRRPISCARRTS